MRTLNLGILAHVDAGKTSLTERLLFAAGVIDDVGSVDRGTTQTDTLALERERGITIKSAVVSFPLGELDVNLIDTPGHPDFIAEVDRVLSLLDGVVLVVSAVEGVQGQTRVLMRAVRRLGIPALIFVNKIDRVGAGDRRVVAAIAARLSPGVVAMETVDGLGTREASVALRGPSDAGFRDDIVAAIADHDDEALMRYVTGRHERYEVLRRRLATVTRRAAVHPVYFGSAITGAGVHELASGIVEFLPSASRRDDGPVSGTVFKVERATTGARTAIVQMRSGTIRIRGQVAVGGATRTVASIAVFAAGGVAPAQQVVGGQIARLGGLGPVQIGDAVGRPPSGDHDAAFSPPPFEAAILPTHDGDRHALRTALAVLAEDDPLINVRQGGARGDLTVSLYGEVQREVIRETLWRDFGIDVHFRDTTTVCIERLVGSGEAEETMLSGRTATAPFLAGVGLRVEPTPPSSGVTFSPGIERGKLPAAFINAVEEAVRLTLRQGLLGWELPDCAVTMTSSAYLPRQSRAHATFDKNMSTIASDFRLLAPLVLVAAIDRAGTIVHEPMHRFHVEAPPGALGPLTATLAELGAVIEAPTSSATTVALRGLVPAARLRTLREQLPGLTHGDAFIETTFDSYRPVHGPPPVRARTDDDPLDRRRYLRKVAARA